MTRNDASTACAHSTLHSMLKQRPAKYSGDAQTNPQERAVDRQAVSMYQAGTEASERTHDAQSRWSDDGGQNTTTLTG